jgi:HPt (histidine-containing phosphotransfer) domain-containing protein
MELPAAAVLDDAHLAILAQDCGDALASLLAVYITESDRRLVDIERWANASNHTQLTHEAHALKGASLTFGCPAVAEAARNLEAAAKSGSSDIGALVERVHAAFILARRSLLDCFPDLAAAEAAALQGSSPQS